MNCRPRAEWQALVAHRLDPELPEPTDLVDALAHLEGCDSCRQTALAADPSLLFHPAVFQPAAEPVVADVAGEVAAMQQAVRAMRRAERVESASIEAQVAESSWDGLRRLTGNVGPGVVGRWAAALVAVTSALLLGAGAWVSPPPPMAFQTAATLPQIPTAAGDAAVDAATDFGPAVDDVLSAMPIIETTGGSVNDDPPLIFEGQETALIWVWDSDVPKDV